MNPSELLVQLKGSANSRKARNLDIVDAVCREQQDRGSKDFSVATIARLCQARKGPSKQTIHNRTGDAYKALIAEWAKFAGGGVKKPKRASENPLNDVLAKIDDPAVRAVMGSVLADNKKLRGEVNLLKSRANVIIDRRAEITSSASRELIQILPPSASLTVSETEALRYAISERVLEDEGWEIDPHGRILSSKSRRTIFKVGFASAIRKVLERESSSGREVLNLSAPE